MVLSTAFSPMLGTKTQDVPKWFLSFPEVYLQFDFAPITSFLNNISTFILDNALYILYNIYYYIQYILFIYFSYNVLC
jgi:hypothetical protein